jgi:hypothetical protein
MTQGVWPLGTPLKRKAFDLSLAQQKRWGDYKKRYRVDEDSIFIFEGFCKEGKENVFLRTSGGKLVQGDVRCFYPVHPQTELEDWL